MTQTDTILRHLKINKDGITSREAFVEYGITRLSAVIHELRKTYDIEGKLIPVLDRNNRKTYVTRYKLLSWLPKC